METQKIELLCPVGSLSMLKAAVSSGADAVYLGMSKFNAREYATNFSHNYLKEAVKICRSNNVKMNLTMNTLIKNSELSSFFNQLNYAYETGIDAVIIQDPSFISIIKESFPGLRVHMSTQAGIMNSAHANIFKDVERINIARELSRENIKLMRERFKKEIEMFGHGALCVCVSGSCLLSSFLGGRSGNRGRCAQPCRRKYNGIFRLSTKELCLIDRIPEIIEMGINALKIEGRMRTPFYVASATSVYRKAIDSYYAGHFQVDEFMKRKLEDAFSRGFTEGKFVNAPVFNPNQASGTSKVSEVMYNVKTKNIKMEERKSNLKEILIKEKPSSGKKLIVKVDNSRDAFIANMYADIIVADMFNSDFRVIRRNCKKPLYALTPRIMFDCDLDKVKDRINEIKPDGLMAGNLGILNMGFKLPMILDYNANCFNDLSISYYEKLGAKPIISPELSINELEKFKNKDFAVFVHGKLRLMTLAHNLPEARIKDENRMSYDIKKIFNGSEITCDKELGLFNKVKSLVSAGINQIYLDPDKNHDFESLLRAYRGILDGKNMDISELQSGTVNAWINRGVQ